MDALWFCSGSKSSRNDMETVYFVDSGDEKSGKRFPGFGGGKRD